MGTYWSRYQIWWKIMITITSQCQIHGGGKTLDLTLFTLGGREQSSSFFIQFELVHMILMFSHFSYFSTNLDIVYFCLPLFK